MQADWRFDFIPSPQSRLYSCLFIDYTVYLKNLEASKLQAEQAERHVDALRESEERFRSAFHHAAGMGLVAPDGRWIQVNKSLCEMLGYSEAELLLGTFQRSTHPDDLNLILEQLNKLRDGTISSLQLEQRYFHKKGHLRWMLLSVTTVNDAQSRSISLSRCRTSANGNRQRRNWSMTFS